MALRARLIGGNEMERKGKDFKKLKPNSIVWLRSPNRKCNFHLNAYY